jgi:hypothetical protein
VSILDNLLDAGRLELDADGNIVDPLDAPTRPVDTDPGWDDPAPF